MPVIPNYPYVRVYPGGRISIIRDSLVI
jgi:hypothetical protein